MAGKGQEHKPHLVNLRLPENTMQGNVTNRQRSGKKQAPDVPVQKGKKGNDKKEDKLMKAGIESRRKKIECLVKSGFFATDIPKSVQLEIVDEVIELKGPDPTALKLAKDKVKQRIQDIKSKSLNITSNQSKILTMNSTLNFIDYHLNIPKLLVTWEVLAVVDQGKMNVFSFDENEAKEMSGKIMACIAEETVSQNDIELPWFKDFCEKEQSRIIIDSNKKGKIKVYMTADLRKTYFDVKRPPRSPPNIDADGSPLQNGASGEQKDPSRNQQAEAGTSNNPQSPRNRGSTHKAELEEDGKAKESTPNSKKDKKSFEDRIDLNNQQIIYLDLYLTDKFLSLCKKDVDYNLVGKQIVLKGKQKHVDTVKKEIVALLESISVFSELACCGKASIPENFMNGTWQSLAKDKKCLVKVIKCEKPVLKAGLVICSESPKMQILCLKGPLYLADVDAMLCPVTDQLEPMGKSAILVKEGLDNSSKQKCFKVVNEKPGTKCNVEDVVPLYETGNLDCMCLYLSVQDQTNKGVFSEPALKKLAQRIIGHLQKNGYQSFGLDLDYDDKPAWRKFSFSLVSHLWKCSAGLKFPILMCCYAENDELFENLDDYLSNTVQIEKSLDPVVLTHLEGKGSTESVINIAVEKGSIVDYDTKVDIIVNSVSASLKLQNGYVSKQLVGKGGPSIQQECDKDHKDGIDIGELAVTNAGKLKCKKIFHVALYTHWIASGNLSIKILKSIIIRCLKEAEDRRLSSIAFPALGTGTLGYPPCLVAKRMFEAVYDFRKSKKLDYLRDVYFVLYEDKDLELFRNVDQWVKTGEKIDLDLPPKHVLYLEEDLETRIIVSDRDYYGRLHFKELRIVFSVNDDSGWKLEWDVASGTYTTAVKAHWTDDGIQESFRSMIKLIKDYRFHVVDIQLPSKALEVPLQRQLSILIDELKIHSRKINKINNKNKGKNVLPDINYISIVRVFVPSEEYSGFEKECTDQYGNSGNGPLWHVSDKSAFPFMVEVVGTKNNANDVLKKVVQDISSIEATSMFKLKIKQAEFKKAKDKLENLKKKGLHVELHEKSFEMTCKGPQSLVNNAKKDFENYVETEICFDMTEDDFKALLYITSEENWRDDITCKYTKGKTVFQINKSAHLKTTLDLIDSKLHRIRSLAAADVIPPGVFQGQFLTLQQQVEDIGQGIFCFLSADEKRIIIKAVNYEQAQQAKYMIEVNLGMVQQGGGRRNQKFTSPDEDCREPVASPSITNEFTMKGEINFKTREVMSRDQNMEKFSKTEECKTKSSTSASLMRTPVQVAERGIRLPSRWSNMGDLHVLQIEIKPCQDSCQNTEWENVKTQFESTLLQARIISIQRIQNKFMWEHYYLKKKEFEHAYGKGCSNELSLFHGTTHDSLDVIAEQNLDPRLAGNRVGALLGQGTYFAISAKYSDYYAKSDSQGHKFMFIVNVLAGESCIGKPGLKRPPMNPDMKPRLFDSCVDNVQNPKVYCIFHDNQYYLEYLIEYT